MGSIIIFRNSLVNTLRSSVPANLNKYLRDDPWIEEVSTRSAREMPTTVELAGPIPLESPENGNLKDTENAIHLHRALCHLTPLQARDPRLWTRMCHVEFWPYMRLRWPVDKHMGNPARAVRFVESRYFVAQSQSRALVRNGMARLWWTAQLSHDGELENPYELTTVLLSTLDITQQILERGIGRADNVLKGFLAFLLRNSNTILKGGDTNRARIRLLAKHLNMYGGISVLDCLRQSDVMDLLETELTRILQNEARPSVGPE